MPRTVPHIQFVMQRLRHIAALKTASPAIKLRACDRIIALENHLKFGAPLYTTEMREQMPVSGEQPENLSGNGLDDTLKAMLDRAERAKNGGANGDKLPES